MIYSTDHIDLPNWYKPHIEAWSKAAIPCTTLWFWNSEIGWAVVHPLLEKYGWRYVNCTSGSSFLWSSLREITMKIQSLLDATRCLRRQAIAKLHNSVKLGKAVFALVK